jgi:hypothetical protein
MVIESNLYRNIYCASRLIDFSTMPSKGWRNATVGGGAAEAGRSSNQSCSTPNGLKLGGGGLQANPPLTQPLATALNLGVLAAANPVRMPDYRRWR